MKLNCSAYCWCTAYSGIDALQALLREEGKVTRRSFQEVYAKVFNKEPVQLIRDRSEVGHVYQFLTQQYSTTSRTYKIEANTITATKTTV